MAQKSSIEQTLETLVDLQRKHADRDFSKLTVSLEALALNVAQLATQQKQTALILPMPKGEGILEESTSEPSKALTKRPY
jgi:hypothetical protein